MNDSMAAALTRRMLGWARTRLGRAADEAALARDAVVFAPHPDDETLGVGGTILRKTRGGARVSIVFMTDGSRSHRHLMQSDELGRVRQAEARAAGAILGVADEDIEFFGFEDGDLGSHRNEAIGRVKEILEEKRPGEVYLPYSGETPVDHQATHRIVRAAVAAVRGNAVLLEYPIWFWAHWPWAGKRPEYGGEVVREVWNSVTSAFPTLFQLRYAVDVRSVLEQKRQALRCHRSQLERLVDDPGWLTLPDVNDGAFLDCFFQGDEFFRRR